MNWSLEDQIVEGSSYENMPTIFLVRHGESQSNAGVPADCPECARLTVRAATKLNISQPI